MTHEQIVWQGITALVTILTIVAAYLKTRTASKTAHVETTEKLDDVKTIVNGQTEALHGRIAELTQALVDAGADVPKPPPPTG